MPIMDTLAKFCEDLAVNAAAGTANVGDVIDLKQARDIGNGQPLYLIVVVSTTFTSAGAATVNIRLVSDAGATPATDGSASVHVQIGAQAYTELVAGKTYQFALPLEGVEYERYLGLQVVTGTATTTAGAITAFLSPDPYAWKAYPEAVS